MECTPLSTARLSAAQQFGRKGSPEIDLASTARVDAIDALRAIALFAMIAYHFCFDLRYFGFIAADFEHGPFWLTARTIILSSFLLLAGVSLVLADARKGSSRHFL